MTSTFTPSLKIEEMATGDQSGTWGDTTNNNFLLFEQAITGYLAKAMADASQTLTDLDGALDEARNMVVEATGLLTGAKNIVVPTAEKVYLAKNSTTGGFAVTFKTAAGTGVPIPPGTARWVYCDGTNVIDGISGPWTPSSNDAQALGLSGTAWADLFLASGGVINWNAGNYTVTHSAGNLAFSGAVTLGTDLAVADGGTGAGTAAAARVNLAAFGVVRIQTFTSSGTYTPNANMVYCQVECVGGGGGGGGCFSNSASYSGAGGGGGGGGYARKLCSASDIGASKTVTIGAAGTAGNSSAGAGGNGGDTSLGALCVGKGGAGGAGGNVNSSIGFGGAGGVAGTGDVTVAGESGRNGIYFAGTALIFTPAGNGGSAGGGWGAGGAEGQNGGNNLAGNAGKTYGGGGSGASCLNVVGGATGGAGAAGIVVVTEYCTQ